MLDDEVIDEIIVFICDIDMVVVEQLGHIDYVARTATLDTLDILKQRSRLVLRTDEHALS